jgi:hypothetical protein
MTKIEAMLPRGPMDSKALWKESAYIQGNRQVLVSAGRQQQAGKLELASLLGLEPSSGKMLAEEIMYRVVICGRASEVFQSGWAICEEDETMIELTKNVIVFYCDRILGQLAENPDWNWPVPTKLNLEYGFLERAERLERSGNIDAALDIIYDQINWRLKEQKFYETDQLLQNVNVAEYSVDLLLGLLTATLPARSKLRSRAQFFSEVEAVLKERGQWEDNLLVGLES